MGAKKVDSISCPNQMRKYGIYVDERPRILFPDIESAQSIIADEITLPLLLKGPLAYLPIRRPTKYEVQDTNLQHIVLTSPHGWDPYGVDCFSSTDNTQNLYQSCQVSTFLSRPLHQLNILYTTKHRSITPEDLMSRWGIGLETSRRTLRSTYQEYTRSADNLTRRFKTARVHSRYRQLTGPYSQFYMDT